MQNKIIALTGAALFGLGVTGLQAQDAQPTATEEDVRQLDEIVVTAQKREQNIKEVPSSVSSISGDMLDELDINTADDLTKITPNLKIGTNGVYNTISMRGLGSGTNKGFEQSVGIFGDDIYFANPARLLTGMFDIERIEVLRGPQGTLFGRNTIAGAISLHSGIVDHDWEFKADATMGENEREKYTLVVNVPIWEDRVATRIGGQYNHINGHVHDRLLDQASGNRTLKSARAKMRFSFGEDTDFVFTLQHQNSLIEGEGGQYHTVPEAYLIALAAFDPDIEGELDDYAHSTNYPSGGEAVYWDYNLHANTRLLDHDLALIIGYSEMDLNGGLDVDYGPAPVLLGLGGGYTDQFSAELRVLSDPGTIEYVGGLYYFNVERYDLTNVVVAPIVLTDTFQFVVPAVADAIADGILPSQELNEETRHTVFLQNVESYAAFGQLTWNINDKWSAIIGARASVDNKELDFLAENYTANNTPGPALVYMTVLQSEEFHIMTGREDKSFTPKASLLYRITDDVNIYATYAEGFKAGGFNDSARNPDQELQFEPEYSTTIEAGVKGDYFGGAARLNVGAFRTEFENLQVSTYNGTDFVVGNAAAAISQGVEVEGMALLPFGFLVSGNFAWTDAYFESFPGAACQTDARTENPQGQPDACSLSGKSLAGTPEFQAFLSANYLNQLGNMPFDLVLGLDYSWQDDVMLATDHDPDDLQEAYDLWHGRIGLRDDDGFWEFTIFFRNIADTLAKTSSHDVPLFSGAHTSKVEAPRSVSGTFRVHF